MLKAMNISLFKMMTAGYLSAEAYSVLKPKTHLSDLSMYNPQNEKLHRRKTKSCLSENEAYP